MSAALLDAKGEERGLTGKINHGFDRLRRAYGRVLDATLNARPAIYVIWIGLSLLTIPMFIMAPKELAPTEDQGIILGIVEAAADATIDQTTFYTAEANRRLMSTPETVGRTQAHGISDSPPSADQLEQHPRHSRDEYDAVRVARWWRFSRGDPAVLDGRAETAARIRGTVAAKGGHQRHVRVPAAD
jgi:multidrug efflux pump subunit AcrB